MPAKRKAVRRLRVFIVDDHPLIRKCLAETLRRSYDLTVCGEAEDVQGALSGIEAQKPQLIVMDISLKGPNGLELLKDLRIRHPGIPSLVLSMHDEALFAERCLQAGAKGYIMKLESVAELERAVRQVLSGKTYVSPARSKRIVGLASAGLDAPAGRSTINRLSDRELEVFENIGNGHGLREIAQELHISVKTVETHKAHIKDKLGLANATQLLQQATHWVHT